MHCHSPQLEQSTYPSYPKVAEIRHLYQHQITHAQQHYYIQDILHVKLTDAKNKVSATVK